MRFINYLLSTIATLIIATSCDTGYIDNGEHPEPPTSDRRYIGTMSVDQNDGTIFVQESVEVEYMLFDDSTMDIVMYQVKFAKAMPLKLDMTIPGVSSPAIENGYALSGDNIVPLALGGEFEKYTITDMEGTIDENTMTLSFMCGEYPVTYEGSAKE